MRYELLRRIFVTALFLSFACIFVVGFTHKGPSEECNCPCRVAAKREAPKAGTEAKQYQATITRKDDKKNSKTFTDTCTAKSNSEATTTFKQRYPGATVSGVKEVK